MKNSFKKAFALASIGAVAVSAASMNVFAAADGGLTQDQINASTYKPTITLSKILLNEVPADKNVKVQLNVNTENYTYASTGFHIYFDKRVECPANPVTGAPRVSKGAACGNDDDGSLMWKTPVYDETASEQDMKGIFFATAGDFNFGSSGVLAEMTLTLPNDAAAGDVYGIDIIYKSNPSAEDLFTNKDKDDVGDAMQAWTFTQGIYNSDTNNNFTADAAHVEKCKALANIDKSYDGYIAIADGEEPPVVTTTTEAEPPIVVTTTTTAAPVVPPVTTTTTEAEPPIVVTTTTGAPVVSDTTTASTVSGETSTKASTTKASTTKASSTSKGGTTTKKTDAPKTGVAGVGVAVAGLAVAIGTAFVLRKKED